MAKTVKPGDLAKVINEELTMYNERVTTNVNAAGEEAMKKLVKRTKATAPQLTGDYVKHISSKRETGPRGDRFIWYVKSPEHRLTHLIVKKHAHRSTPDPFLANAVDEIIPEYENAVEEAVQNG